MLRECPCGSESPYASCCGRHHHGEPAPTAEALMRSRYAAFVVGDAAYLRRTWAPETRPRRVDAPAVRWTGLEVLATAEAGPDGATVSFRAHHAAGVVAENSRFRRDGDRWLYVGPA